MEFKKQYTTASLEEIEGKSYFVASDDTVDREGESISIDGWDLKNFKRNPILLWSHDPKEPIGVAETIGFKNINGKKKLVIIPKFHDVTQKAREIAELVKMGIINTLSVGFLGKELSADGKTFVKQELLEVSFVSVPANPNATALALSKGISEETVKEVFKSEEIKDVTDEEVQTEAKETEEIEDIIAEDELEVKYVTSDELSIVLDKLDELSNKIEAINQQPKAVREGRATDGDMVRRLTVAIQKQSESITREKNPQIVSNVSKNITKLAELIIKEQKK